MPGLLRRPDSFHFTPRHTQTNLSLSITPTLGKARQGLAEAPFITGEGNRPRDGGPRKARETQRAVLRCIIASLHPPYRACIALQRDAMHAVALQCMACNDVQRCNDLKEGRQGSPQRMPAPNP
jgi:hypothetical protein